MLTRSVVFKILLYDLALKDPLLTKQVRSISPYQSSPLLRARSQREICPIKRMLSTSFEVHTPPHYSVVVGHASQAGKQTNKKDSCSDLALWDPRTLVIFWAWNFTVSRYTNV